MALRNQPPTGLRTLRPKENTARAWHMVKRAARRPSGRKGKEGFGLEAGTGGEGSHEGQGAGGLSLTQVLLRVKEGIVRGSTGMSRYVPGLPEGNRGTFTRPQRNPAESPGSGPSTAGCSPLPLGVRYMEYLFMVSGALHSLV